MLRHAYVGVQQPFRMITTPFELSTARQPERSIDDDPTGMIAATIASGLAQLLEIAPPSEHEDIIACVDELRTRQEGLDYLKEVHALVQEARHSAVIERSPTVRLHQLREGTPAHYSPD